MTIESNDPAQPVVTAEQLPAENTAVVSEPLSPTTSKERIQAIDILRGLALFGILGANIRGFSGPAQVYFEPQHYWPGFADRIAQAFVDAFIQGKFITIFAFLFGVGFTVQMTRAKERGAKFTSVYIRRLLVLAAIGLAHGLLVWFGDILLPYALLGFALLLFGNRKDKTVLIWAIVTYLVPLLLMTVMYVGSALADKPMPAPKPPTAEKLQTLTETFANGSFAEVQAQRMKDAVGSNWGFAPFFGWQLLGLFLFGMLAYRRKFFEPSAESLARYRKWMIIALAVGVVGNVTAVTLRWMFSIPMMPPTGAGVALMYLQTVATPALSFGYATAVILLVQNPLWRARLSRFGAIGRTALSNYLLQSIVGTLLFYGYGLGFFGTGPALLLIPAVLIYAAQAVIAPWWVARFQFGPAEWLWRSLTYMKAQPMIRSAAAPQPPAAQRAA